MQTLKMGPLTCRVLGARDGERPRAALVLCHGFGAPGDDLVAIGHELLRERPERVGKTWLVFPEAPLDLSALGMWGARAWWELDMVKINAMMASGQLRDLANEEPEGLGRARRMLLGALDRVCALTGLPMSQIVLGGFSQGAMLTTDVTLRMDEPPAALAVLSGTLLAEEIWTRLAPRRAGMHALITHGTSDPILPYMGAEALRDRLAAAGWTIDFSPFPGGHTVTRESLAWIGARLDALAG